MNAENCKIVQEAVKEAGAHLAGKLPPCSYLLKRNPYAHLWERIKSTMGRTYKECDDSQLQEILALISYCRENPC